jgi:predicted transglutaminase-like cysteine proteinase
MLLASCAALLPACSQSALAQRLALRATEPVPAPAGFATFCSANPSECARSGPLVRQVPLTPGRWHELQSINSHINDTISEVSDLDLHGRGDVWSIPVGGRGDCEDYALLKRKLLLERGWPSSAVLVTVVRTGTGEGHAVLTVVTDQGDYVLDNKTARIRRWFETGYMFFTRQTQSNPRSWTAVIGETPRSYSSFPRSTAFTQNR